MKKKKLDRSAAGVERAQCAPWSVWVGKASAHASPSRHCRRRALSPPARGTASEMPPKSDAVVKEEVVVLLLLLLVAGGHILMLIFEHLLQCYREVSAFAKKRGFLTFF